MSSLKYDPLNIVVCGIGGQGNVLAAEVLGSAMVDRGAGWPLGRLTVRPSAAGPL